MTKYNNDAAREAKRLLRQHLEMAPRGAMGIQSGARHLVEDEIDHIVDSLIDAVMMEVRETIRHEAFRPRPVFGTAFRSKE